MIKIATVCGSAREDNFTLKALNIVNEEIRQHENVELDFIDAAKHAGTGIAYGDAGPGRRAIRFTGHAEATAAGLRDHVEGEVFLEWAAFAEALDLGIDDAWVDRLHHVVGQAQTLDRAGGEILHHHVRAGDHILDQIEALRRLQVDCDRHFIGVEHVEIIRIIVRFIGLQAAAGIAHFRILDFHHVRAQPGERFRTGGAGLELSEIDHLDALQEGEIGHVIGHGRVSSGPCVAVS